MATKNISLGDTNNIAMALGSAIISKAYLGDVLVYDGGDTINLTKNIDNTTNMEYNTIEDLFD